MQVKPSWHIICWMRMVKDLWKFFMVRNLTRWWTSSNPCVLPTFETSLYPLIIVLVLEAPWITHFSLSQWVLMTTSKIVVSLDKWLGKRCLCLKCCFMGQQVGLIWWGACNSVVICRIFGWCLIMSSVFKYGPSWLVMFKTHCIAKCSPFQFVTCNLNPQKFNVSGGQKWTTWCSSLVVLQKVILQNNKGLKLSKVLTEKCVQENLNKTDQLGVERLQPFRGDGTQICALLVRLWNCLPSTMQ